MFILLAYILLPIQNNSFTETYIGNAAGYSSPVYELVSFITIQIVSWYSCTSLFLTVTQYMLFVIP